MALALIVAALACAFGLASSMLVNWASARSPLWNIGFFLGLVVASASILLLAVTLLSRRLSP